MTWGIRHARSACVIGLASCALELPQASGQAAWRELGPAPTAQFADDNVGRVAALACIPGQADSFLVAAADGGVWRTDDGGQTWIPLTNELPTSAFGALALDPTDSDVIYAGSGEANYANHSRYGLGLFKSADGGATWQQLGEATFAGRCFSSIVVNPVSPQIVYAAVTRAGGFPELAAAKRHPMATGPVGLFRSQDGGQTWEQLTNGLPALSATSVSIDLTNPSVLICGIGDIFGDAGNGIYRSADGGESWQRLSVGLPADWAVIGRITVCIAPSDGTRVYALITNAADATGGQASTQGGYRSQDGGQTWTRLQSLDPNLQATYGWFLSVVSVYPTNPNMLLMGGLNLVRSNDAGQAWQTVTPPHVDIHALAWDANGHLLCGNDGGVHRTHNLGDDWETLNDGLGIIQFYPGLSLHPQDEQVVLGGTQDNGSNVRRADSLEWEHVQGGDGGWTQIAQAVPARWYTEFQGTGNLFRSNNNGGTWVGVRTGIAFGDRNCFLPPYLVDLNSENNVRMLYCTQRVYETVNRGTNWTAISGDLTKGAGAIRALAIAPSDSTIVYAATNDGNVLRSDDGGANWTLLLDDNPGWPRTTRELFVDPQDPMTVYLAGAVFGAPKVRRSTDGGHTWATLDGDLPDVPINVVAADVRGVTIVLYAGSDQTLYRSFDDGVSWRRVGRDLPTAAVTDIVLDLPRNRAVIGTQGRGAWEIAAGVPGDVDFDSDVDLADLSALLADLDCSGACVGDVDGDLDVDIDDLRLMLLEFGGRF